jgi:hypothetical protein
MPGEVDGMIVVDCALSFPDVYFSFNRENKVLSFEMVTGFQFPEN